MSTINDDTVIRPFEWLTSPSSLRGLLSTLSVQEHKRALHIGSGSSTVGEYLVEELSYDYVMDVDKDAETVERMKQRWHERCQVTGMDPMRLQHCIVDFTESSIETAPDASFPLVLDKSTLDCTLCSDNATAALLVEVYRCLAVGGVYVLISFHSQDLLLPLLRDLPGASWEITCQTMDRQAEKLDMTASTSASFSVVVGDNEPNSVADKDSHNASSMHQHHHPPLNVLLARKLETHNHRLYMDQIRNHVHAVNHEWFQQTQPLLTHMRKQELQTSFEIPKPLVQAYAHLFTEAEREQLTFDNFMEDWHVFWEGWKKKQALLQGEPQDEGHDDDDDPDSVLVSYEMAVEFLQEMQ